MVNITISARATVAGLAAPKQLKHRKERWVLHSPVPKPFAHYYTDASAPPSIFTGAGI